MSDKPEATPCFDRFYKTCRWFGALCGAAAVVTGGWGIVSNIMGVSISGIIVSLYLIPLGFIAFLIQVKFIKYEWVIRNFTVVKSDFGKGNYFIFTGGLCIAASLIIGYVVGACCILVGLFYIAWSCKYRSPNQEVDGGIINKPMELNDVPAPPTSYSTPSQPQQSVYGNPQSNYGPSSGPPRSSYGPPTGGPSYGPPSTSYGAGPAKAPLSGGSSIGGGTTAPIPPPSVGGETNPFMGERPYGSSSGPAYGAEPRY